LTFTLHEQWAFLNEHFCGQGAELLVMTIPTTSIRSILFCFLFFTLTFVHKIMHTDTDSHSTHKKYIYIVSLYFPRQPARQAGMSCKEELIRLRLMCNSPWKPQLVAEVVGGKQLD